MADTLIRLVGPKQLATSATTEYTVPSSTVTVIRNIHLSNPSTGEVTVTMSIGADAAGTRLFDGYPVPPKSILHLPCSFVLTATEVLQCSTNTATTLVATIDGVEIT